METVVWLVFEWQGGRWWLRHDLPAAIDATIARAYAEDQTRMSGRKHAACRFSLSDPHKLTK